MIQGSGPHAKTGQTAIGSRDTPETQISSSSGVVYYVPNRAIPLRRS
jgi:hypothetical protein